MSNARRRIRESSIHGSNILHDFQLRSLLDQYVTFLNSKNTLPLRMKNSGDAVFLYVAPDGSDSWSGRTPTPNRFKTDGPLATLRHALEVVRELKRQQDGTLKQPVTVLIRGGTYFLNEPLIFKPEDSGTLNHPVCFAAYPGEKPVVSGGRLLTGWKQTVVNGRKLWVAEIPETSGGKWFFRNLWVNGHRCTRARSPNKGYFKIAGVPDVTPETKWNEGQNCFRFFEGDLKAWSTVDEGEIVVMNRWVESRLPITRVEEEEHTVCSSRRSVFRLEPGDLYYVEHVYELLDSPGEWFLDRNSSMLYYIPLPGEEPSKVEAVAPVLSELIRFEGKPEEDLFVENLFFQGLAFAHAEWFFKENPDSGKPSIGGFPQAAIGVPGSIHGDGVRNCIFEDCTFTHLGNYALELARGCQNNRVAGCRFFDLGAGGVKIGETLIREAENEQTYGNEVTGCHIYEGGRFFHSAVAILIGQSYNNRVTRNHIHDFYYTGVSIGWTWGYGRSLAKGNIVESNHIHHIGVLSNGEGPILSDMGGVYTLGVQPGTVVRLNLIHDVAGLRYGGWGIYFDEGSTNIIAEENIVYNTSHGGFHQHYGRENIIRNNIFAFGREAQIQRTRPEQHVSFVFERNIVYWREGSLLTGRIGDLGFVFDHNLYWKEGDGEILFGEFSWEEWRKRGMDRNSLIADPLFNAPDKYDFSLKPESPAFKLGFTARLTRNRSLFKNLI
ncbi:MAG: right-handed parallel beta-helix repeat-containing protein [Thaumarchaeota archaeon]|nr:right-handed parallel beta-helix repeat-containing protein [Nitrososphaerota archaeon]